MKFKELLHIIASDAAFNKKKCTTLVFLKAFFFDPAFRLIMNYRIGRYLYLNNKFWTKPIMLRLKLKQVTRRACQISYKAEIGEGVRFMHPLGIVIGDNVVIHKHVRIWQQVTFGSHGKKGESLSYPTVQEHTKVYAGAKIIGDINIGKNAVIAANAVVTRDVPGNTTAVGIPARILN